MSHYGKCLAFALAAGATSMLFPSLAPAAIIYSNGFESGNQPRDDFGSGSGQSSAGFCSRGGTNPLLGHTGCPTITSTESVGVGNGDFVAFTNPETRDNGDVSRGSVLGINGPRLPDGFTGTYELSFNGSDIRQLVFVDQVWTPFLFYNPEAPNEGEIPTTYNSGEIQGTTVSIENGRYSVLFDLDERQRVIGESGPPGVFQPDPARFSICGSETDQSNCTMNWYFAIDNGGWIDDIELNYLSGGGEEVTQVPEPSTIALLLTGLVTTGAFSYRRKNQV